MIGPIDHAKSMHFQYDLASLVQSRGLQVPLLTLPKGHHVCSFSHSSTLHALKSLGLAVPREESCNHGTKPHNPVIQGNIWWTLVDSLGDVSDVHTYGKFDPCTSSEIQTPGDSWGTWRSPRYKLRRQLEGNWINWFRLWIFYLGPCWKESTQSSCFTDFGFTEGRQNYVHLREVFSAFAEIYRWT